MTDKCPDCGHNLVLFEEWQKDVWRCPSCGHSVAAPRECKPTDYIQCAMADLGASGGLPLSHKKLGGRGPGRRKAWRVSLTYIVVMMVLPMLIVLTLELLDIRPPNPLWVFYPLLAVYSLALYIRYVLPYRRRAKDAIKQLEPSASATGPDEIGALATICFDKQHGPAARDRLIAATPAVTDKIAAVLSPQELSSLLGCLLPDVYKRWAPNWALVAAACQVFSHTACGQALWPLGRLAADAIKGHPVPAEVRAEAETAAAAIRERMLRAAQETTLLRAASPTDDSTSLLRTAGMAEEPAEQLLRRTDDVEPDTQTS
jgi:DNA-directed RNA polymerase subunit RPC12/RpoP